MNFNLLATGLVILGALVVFLLTAEKSTVRVAPLRPVQLPALSFGREQLLKWGARLVSGLVVLGTLLFMWRIIGTNPAEEEAQTQQQAAASEELLMYNLLRVDSTARQLHFKISVPANTPKETLIDITRSLKEDYRWKKPLICVFFPETDTTAALASISYCPNCATDKDSDGNPVAFRKF
jgi:hypothetical protein